MLTLVVISCLIFQTAVAIYLLRVSLVKDDFEINLQKFLLILLVHLCTKYFLLAVLHNSFLYGKLATGFSLFYGPFLLITAHIFIGKPLWQKEKVLHLAPFFGFSVIYIFLVAGNFLKIINDNFIALYAGYYQWFVVASLISYPLIIKNRLKKSINNNTVPDEKRKQLIDNIASVLLLVVLLIGVFTFAQFLKIPLANFDLRALAYGCFCIIPVLILSYKMQQKPAVVDNKTTEEEHEQEPDIEEPVLEIDDEKPEKKYQKSGLDDIMLQTYQALLIKFIEKNKVYLDAELSLDSLAEQTKIPKHHLTQLLNDKINKNFYLFINEYRINEAIRILKSPAADVNILSLAYDCGFNSKSSFNNYFKKITGYTPSAFRKTNATVDISVR